MYDFNQTNRRRFLNRALELGAFGLIGSPLATLSATAAPKGSSQKGWQIGCYTRPWDQYDYRVALDDITEAGFRYVGLMTTKSETGIVISVRTSLEEARTVHEEVQQRGLEILSVYGGNFALHSLKAAVADLQKLVNNCAAVESKTLLLAGTSDPNAHERYYKAVAETAEYAAEKGVELVLKPHGGTNGTGTACRKTIEAVGNKNFRLWYDPGNIYFYSEGQLDPVREAAVLDGIITGMCVKDYQRPGSIEVTPGDGLVDFPALFHHLKKGGFTGGPLVIETLSPGDRATLRTQAQKARLYLERSAAG